MEELLTVYEAARLFKVNPQTIYHYIKSGELKAFKATRKAIRIRQKDFYDFVKRNPLS
jgi:excisionase family DNA binding protein